MSGKTTIAWATKVWNPTTGCTRVSDGCTNCYAFALHDKRYKANLDQATPAGARSRLLPGQTIPQQVRALGHPMPYPKQYDLPFSRVQLLPDRLDEPLRWRKPERVFVDSMADLFHEDVPDEFIARVFNTMCAVPYKDGEPKPGWWDENPHRYLILTKRPERMRDVVTRMGEIVEKALAPDDALPVSMEVGGWPLPNVWLGTSVEDQEAADERIPHLIATPAAVRFLSCEPLIGPVDLGHFLVVEEGVERPCGVPEHAPPHHYRGLRPALHWVIVGGESGPRARPMDLAWARSLRDQCRSARAAFFMKQLGAKPVERTPGEVEAGMRGLLVSIRDRKGEDPDEWPEDLRIREWPAGYTA